MARALPPTLKTPPEPPREGYYRQPGPSPVDSVSRQSGFSPADAVYPSRAYFLQSQGLPPNCDAAQFSDSVVCPCGMKWDINDCDPLSCRMHVVPDHFPTFRIKGGYAAGIAVQPLIPRQVSQAQRRLSALYSEPREALLAIWLGRYAAWAITAALAVGIIWSFWP